MEQAERANVSVSSTNMGQHKKQRCEQLWLSHRETPSPGLSQHLCWLSQELDRLLEQIHCSGQERRKSLSSQQQFLCWKLSDFSGKLPFALALFLVPGGL